MFFFIFHSFPKVQTNNVIIPKSQKSNLSSLTNCSDSKSINIFNAKIRFYNFILPIYEKYSDMLDLAVAGRL